MRSARHWVRRSRLAVLSPGASVWKRRRRYSSTFASAIANVGACSRHPSASAFTLRCCAFQRRCALLGECLRELVSRAGTRRRGLRLLRSRLSDAAGAGLPVVPRAVEHPLRATSEDSSTFDFGLFPVMALQSKWSSGGDGGDDAVSYVLMACVVLNCYAGLAYCIWRTRRIVFPHGDNIEVEHAVDVENPSAGGGAGAAHLPASPTARDGCSAGAGWRGQIDASAAEHSCTLPHLQRSTYLLTTVDPPDLRRSDHSSAAKSNEEFSSQLDCSS
jgi:hypothetical protein